MRSTASDGRHLEIERRFLISYPSMDWLQGYPGGERVEILQTYFTTETEEKLRVRIWRTRDKTSYILTRKTKVTEITRIEEESELTEAEYRDMLAGAASDVRQLSKVRYRLPYRGRIVEVDIYPFWTDKAVAEVELESEDEEVLLPDEITVTAEVTGNKDYTNYSLAVDITGI